MRGFLICCALLMSITSALTLGAHAEEPVTQANSVRPSTLVEYIHLQHHLFPDLTRQEIVQPLKGIATTKNDSRQEQFYYAEFLFLSLNGKSAHTEFSKLAGGDDWFGRFSMERLMLIESRAFDDPVKVSATLERYRRTYWPDPSDIMGMY